MKLLVSACLLGARCRYDGKSAANPAVLALAARHTLIPVCPEQLGGLSTPRAPAERCAGRVKTCGGADVTDAYALGASEALRLCRLLGCEAAVLKARSPSCGMGVIYDGTFTGTRVLGDGMTAEALLAAGIPVYTEETLPDTL